MNLIEIKTNEILSNTLGREDLAINDALSLDDLGIDSIEKAEILVTLQKIFSIKLDLAEFQALPTIRNIYEYLEKKIKIDF